MNQLEIASFLQIPPLHTNDSVWYVEVERLQKLINLLQNNVPIEPEVDMFYYLRSILPEVQMKLFSSLRYIHLNSEDYNNLKLSVKKNFQMDVNSLNSVLGYGVKKSLVNSFFEDEKGNRIHLFSLERLEKHRLEYTPEVKCS